MLLLMLVYLLLVDGKVYSISEPTLDARPKAKCNVENIE